jgi:hypothetical protein
MGLVFAGEHDGEPAHRGDKFGRYGRQAARLQGRGRDAVVVCQKPCGLLCLFAQCLAEGEEVTDRLQGAQGQECSESDDDEFQPGSPQAEGRGDAVTLVTPRSTTWRGWRRANSPGRNDRGGVAADDHERFGAAEE